MKDEKRRLKHLEDVKKTDAMEIALQAIFNELSGDAERVSSISSTLFLSSDGQIRWVLLSPQAQLTDLDIFSNLNGSQEVTITS